MPDVPIARADDPEELEPLERAQLIADVARRFGVSPAVRGLEPEPGGISEQALSILISLASGPRHGYAMIHDIAAFSGAR